MPFKANRAISLGVGLLALSSACRLPSQATRCIVNEPHLRLNNINVLVPGSGFTLSVDDVKSRVELSPGKSTVRIEVMAPLHFSASYPREDLRIRLVTPVEAFGGRFKLGRGAVPRWLRVQGDTLRALAEPVVPVQLIQSLAIPCHQLGIAGGEPYATPSLMQAGNEQRGIGSNFVSLFTAPRAVDPLRVRYAGPFAVVERQSNWVLLEAKWSDGTRLVGWTPESNAVREFELPKTSVEGTSSLRICGHSDGAVFRKSGVRVGARVHTRPEGPVWATTAGSVTAEIDEGGSRNDWVRVVGITGVRSDPCIEQNSMWLQADDLLSPALVHK